MWLHVCDCVLWCVYVCVHAYEHVCACVCACVCVYVCVRGCVCVCVQACTQFQQIDHTTAANHSLVLALKKVDERSTTEVYDQDGSWCDIWSLGVSFLWFYLRSADDIMEVQYFCGHKTECFNTKSS